MVNLKRLSNNKPFRVCSIDASTNSLAFAIFHGDDLKYCGKINFSGKDIYEKVADAGRKTKSFFDVVSDFDAVVIEHTVFINSPKTAADLALVQGAILGGIAASSNVSISSVSPMTWQNFIGNKRLTSVEKLEIVANNPGKSASWLKTHEREVRKQRTIRFVNVIYDKKIKDNDVADAIAIGHWAISS
jgi:Holliday junction resolvasome RuvABC endonuclease subunit